jgi:IclR helix-turn-helix domain
MARGQRHTSAGQQTVAIALTRDQVDQVMRAALRQPRGASESVLLFAALDSAHQPSADAVGTDTDGRVSESFRDATKRALKAALEDSQLSQSLLRGLALLSCYTPDREWRTISDLAKELDLPPSTAHRYARTLRAIGLLEQHPGTREYRPAAAA